MRAYGWMLAIVGAALFLSVQASASTVVGPFSNLGSWNLVGNGDFAADLSGWSLIGSGGSFSQSSTPGPDNVAGTALALNAVSISGAGYAEQTGFAVNPGTEYVLSGFIKLVGSAAGNAYLDLNDTSFDPNVLATPGVGEWQFVYATFTPNVSSVTIRLVRDVGSNAGDQVLFDKIAITPATAFAAATAVPLPGAALAGLALMGAIGAVKTLRRQ